MKTVLTFLIITTVITGGCLVFVLADIPPCIALMGIDHNASNDPFTILLGEC